MPNLQSACPQSMRSKDDPVPISLCAGKQRGSWDTNRWVARSKTRFSSSRICTLNNNPAVRFQAVERSSLKHSRIFPKPWCLVCRRRPQQPAIPGSILVSPVPPAADNRFSLLGPSPPGDLRAELESRRQRSSRCPRLDPSTSPEPNPQ